MKAPSMEQLYQDALNPKLYPNDRLLAVMQGRDSSIPMAVAMAAKQQRDRLMIASQGAEAQQQAQAPTVRDQMLAQAAPPQMAETGVAALPAENMQQLAEGGIAFADNFDPTDDEMQNYAEGGDVNKFDTPISAPQGYTLLESGKFIENPTSVDLGTMGVPEYIKHIATTTANKLTGQRMAGGGMVAFNTGGMPSFNDEEDADTDDDDELLSQIIKTGGLGGFAAGANMLRQKIGAMMPKSYETALLEAKKTPSAAPAPTAGGSHRDIALKAAQEKGATPWLVEHVMKKETGGHKDPARAVSSKGATGVMQLMPGTAREMGVSDITDPQQNIYGGVGYIAKLEKKYGDPKLAAIAYNWGPGNTDKWLKRGGDFSKLPKETRNYVKNLAKGGIISFANRGSVPAPMDEEGYYYPPTETPESEFGRDWQLAQTRRKNKLIEIQKRIAEPIKKVKQYFAKSTPEEYDLLSQQPNVGVPATIPAAPAAPAAPAPLAFDPNYKLQKDPNYVAASDYKSAIDKYFSPATTTNPAQDRLNDYFLNLAKQQKEAQGLGLLGTGLQIAGGTSPYAMANIGQGGAKGIQDYLASRRGLGTLEAQGMSAQAALDRNRMMSEAYGREPEQVRSLKAIAADPVLRDLYTKAGATEKISRTEAVKQFNDIVEKNPRYKRELEALGIKDPNAYYQYLMTGTPPLVVSSTIPQGAKTRQQQRQLPTI